MTSVITARLTGNRSNQTKRRPCRRRWFRPGLFPFFELHRHAAQSNNSRPLSSSSCVVFLNTLICCLAKQLYGVQRTTHTRGDSTGGIKSLASWLITSGVKKQHNKVETGNVKGNLLHWGVRLPSEAGHASRGPAGRRGPARLLPLGGLIWSLCQTEAAPCEDELSGDTGPSCEEPRQTNSPELQRWQRSFWTHLWRPTAGKRGATHSFTFHSLSLHKSSSVWFSHSGMRCFLLLTSVKLPCGHTCPGRKRSSLSDGTEVCALP